MTPVQSTGNAATSASRVFPTTCAALVAPAKVNTLVGATLVASGSAPAPSGDGQSLTCRYQKGAGAPPEFTIVIVASEYADTAAATTQDAAGRQAVEAQGGSFTPVERVGDEAYSFVYPKLFGISARLGRHTLTLGIGNGLTPPTTEAINTMAQEILSDLGR